VTGGPETAGPSGTFATKVLPAEPTALAPDGSAVRVLVGVERGGMAHFALAPGEVAVAVRHRTVEELWYFVQGSGEMWRRLDDHEETVDVVPGVAIPLPVGTAFQFRSTSDEPLAAVGVTMPPWPGEGEAVLVEGPWAPTVDPGPH
jgi:mannose-6-phosphate isomerase-like protein (cupin superfamily)